MGKMENGPYGPVSGKVGKTVSYMLNGKNVIRNIGRIKKKPSVKQLINRQKMKVVNDFLKPIKPFINLGFKFAVEGTDKNTYNKAVSYHKMNAITGDYPNQMMDYNRVKLSEGELEPAVNPSVNLTAGGVEFTWEMPTPDNNARRRDRVMLMVYFPELHKATYLLSGATRETGNDFLALQTNMVGQPIEAYISFLAWDANSVADSVYIGSL